MTDRAVVLVSGGLDSATCLTIALDQGYDCFALSFDYGQRSVSELAVAKRVVESRGGYRAQDCQPGSRRTRRIGSHRQEFGGS